MNKLQKPANFVGNTVYMMDKILSLESASNDVYYLADYPEYSVQEWASTISKCFVLLVYVGNTKMLGVSSGEV